MKAKARPRLCRGRAGLSINPRPCHSEPVTDVTGVGIRNPLRGGIHVSRRKMRTRRRGTRAPPYGAGALSTRRGRRPAVERSGTNALGIRRSVSAAVPRCEAPSGRGLSAQPTGGEKNAWHLSLCQRFALPPPSQREARGLHIPLRGGTHGSRPTASDICDRAGFLTD